MVLFQGLLSTYFWSSTNLINYISLRLFARMTRNLLIISHPKSKNIQCNVQLKLHNFTMLDSAKLNCSTSLLPTIRCILTIRNSFPFYFNQKCRLFVLRTRNSHTTKDHYVTKMFDMVKEWFVSHTNLTPKYENIM